MLADPAGQSFSEGPLVELNGICKNYHMGEVIVEALRGVDFILNRGEMTCIMGSSGSGKSTLLNILGCLDRPTSGVYRLMSRRVDGMDDNELASIRNRFIGFIFQTFNLLPRATALHNVELPLIYARVPRKERRERAATVLERVGLADRSTHRPTQLSGGERQRVAIARALVTDPALLLADEPTGNLDSGTGARILELFGKLHQEGNTILLVSHDQAVGGICRRIVRIRDGFIDSDSGTGA